MLGDRRLALTAPGAETAENRGDDSLSQGPPGHTRLRRLVSAALTHRRVADLRSRVAKVATGLAGAMLARRPPADLMEKLGFGIAAIGELLGVPAAERDGHRAWSNAPLRPPADEAAPGTRWERLWAQVGDLIARKRAQSAT